MSTLSILILLIFHFENKIVFEELHFWTAFVDEVLQCGPLEIRHNGSHRASVPVPQPDFFYWSVRILSGFIEQFVHVDSNHDASVTVASSEQKTRVAYFATTYTN